MQKERDRPRGFRLATWPRGRSRSPGRAAEDARPTCLSGRCGGISRHVGLGTQWGCGFHSPVRAQIPPPAPIVSFYNDVSRKRIKMLTTYYTYQDAKKE